jgi:hypothetical protein
MVISYFSLGVGFASGGFVFVLGGLWVCCFGVVRFCGMWFLVLFVGGCGFVGLCVFVGIVGGILNVRKEWRRWGSV